MEMLLRGNGPGSLYGNGGLLMRYLVQDLLFCSTTYWKGRFFVVFSFMNKKQYYCDIRAHACLVVIEITVKGARNIPSQCESMGYESSPLRCNGVVNLLG